MIDESEVLTPADPTSTSTNTNMKFPLFVVPPDLVKPRRIWEGAAMIRTKVRLVQATWWPGHPRPAHRPGNSTIQSLDDHGLDLATEKIMERYRVLASTPNSPAPTSSRPLAPLMTRCTPACARSWTMFTDWAVFPWSPFRLVASPPRRCLAHDANGHGWHLRWSGSSSQATHPPWRTPSSWLRPTTTSRARSLKPWP